jgi:hypothetical protein
MYTRGLLLVSILSPKIHTAYAYVVVSRGDVSYDTNKFTTQQRYFGLPWLRVFYPDWGFPSLTGVLISWLRFFYPDWSFRSLTGVFITWLRFFYHDWGFYNLAEVLIPWLKIFYTDWGFLPWLKFFYPVWGFCTLTEVFPCFFLSFKANARV